MFCHFAENKIQNPISPPRFFTTWPFTSHCPPSSLFQPHWLSFCPSNTCNSASAWPTLPTPSTRPLCLGTYSSFMPHHFCWDSIPKYLVGLLCMSWGPRSLDERAVHRPFLDNSMSISGLPQGSWECPWITHQICSTTCFPTTLGVSSEQTFLTRIISFCFCVYFL